MELILISKSKLKIMLDERDMLEYHISDGTDCAEPSARKAIRNILDRARAEVGFETEGSEIFIQLYTSKKGGCELFVSKSKLGVTTSIVDAGKITATDADTVHNTETTKEEPEMRKNDSEEKDKKTVKEEISAKSGEQEKKSTCSRMAFSFPSLAELFSVCRVLKKNEAKYRSSAFTDVDGRAYLFLWGVGASLYTRLDRLTFILEYGKRENPSLLLTYIGERGKTICEERAIEILANF